MLGLTDYTIHCSGEDILTVWFVWVDDLYKALCVQGRIRRGKGPPPLSDSEVITLGLFCDTFFQGKEELALSFVRQHYLENRPGSIPSVARLRK